MNRSGRDYHLVGGRNFSQGSLNLRRGHSLTGGAASVREADEDLDLFSRNRRSISVVASDESSDASALKMGRLSVSLGTAKLARSGVDDLLSSDSGKNDYDWLLTPPGTPLFAPSEVSEPQTKVAAPRTSSLSRSISTTKASRLSVSQSEVSHHTSRPTRSSSVTRSSSLSTSQFNTYSSNNRSSSSILNTSSASVSSYTRPSSPITRSSSTAARPSTPSTRSSTSRPSTPSRIRPSPSTSFTEKPRPTLTSRPSTPTSRPQMSSTSTLPSTRSTSRPSTPTRRNSAPSLSSSTVSSISTSRVSSNSRPSSRPSSPGPRVRPPQQPIVLPDFSHNTPPNLRTTLPDRPLSAGRSRPAPSATAKGNPETAPPSTLPRRQPSPIVTRGRLSVSESNGRGGRSHSSTTAADFHEPRRASHAPDLGMKKPVKNVTNVPEINGFGRNISKKSLDMAIRHMDIRNGNGSLRALSNTTLFPQSIRSTSKTQSNRAASVHPNGSSDAASDNGSWIENGSLNGNYSAKLSDLDMYESSRYDAILLKEDMKNMNWLHSVDDKSEVGSIFDSGFETLPEPFGPL